MSHLLKLTLALSTVLFISCKQVKISANEDKAVSEIVDLYGGLCTYSVGTRLSTTHGKQTSFEMEVTGSPFFDQNTMWTEMHASNFAYIFYTHTQNDQKRYDKVKAAIVYKDGAKFNFEYSFDSLKIVSSKMGFVKQIVNTLKGKDYPKIDQLLITDVFVSTNDKEKYLDFIKTADSTFGTIESFTPTGFRFGELKNGDQCLHISGNLKRSIKNSQFSVDIHPGEKNELYLIAYDY